MATLRAGAAKPRRLRIRARARLHMCAYVRGDSAQPRNECWHFLQSGQGPFAESAGITCNPPLKRIRTRM